jgi:hypothetical protein
MGRNGRSRGPAILGAVISALLLIGCGGEASQPVNKADLPAPLVKAIPPLRRAGFDVQARAVGPDHVPSLVVEGESHGPVLLLAAPQGLKSNTSLPIDLTPDVGFDIPLSTYCGRIEAAGPSSAAQTRVLRSGGICG